MLLQCPHTHTQISFSAPSKTIAANEWASEKNGKRLCCVVVVRIIMMIEFYVQITLDNNMAGFFCINKSFIFADLTIDQYTHIAEYHVQRKTEHSIEVQWN